MYIYIYIYICVCVCIDDKPVYNLVWYKKKGDSAANSIECSSILSMTLRESSRPVSFLTDKGTLLLSHEIDEENNEDCVEVKQSKGKADFNIHTCIHTYIHTYIHHEINL